MRIQKKLLKLIGFIDDFQKKNCYCPSIREMCNALDVKSTCTVKYYLTKIEEAGVVRRPSFTSRALEIVLPREQWCEALGVMKNTPLYNEYAKQASKLKKEEKNEVVSSDFSSALDEEFISVPLIGKVAAGEPILAVENREATFNLPNSLFNKENLFMLEVKGESMINVGIYSGDKIVVRQQNDAVNGEIVVALVDDSATVKRFFKEKDGYRLQPENDTMQPIYVKDVTILGKVVGLIRSF